MPRDPCYAPFHTVPADRAQRLMIVKNDKEMLLKTELTCFHCDLGFSNMPTLKSHLAEHFAQLRTHGAEA